MRAGGVGCLSASAAGSARGIARRVPAAAPRSPQQARAGAGRRKTPSARSTRWPPALGELQAAGQPPQRPRRAPDPDGKLGDGEFDFDKPPGRRWRRAGRPGHPGQRELRRRLYSCWSSASRLPASQLSVLESLMFNHQLRAERDARRACRSPTATSPPASAPAPIRSAAARASTRASTSTPTSATRCWPWPTAWSASPACKRGYGNVVEVDHGNGYVTRYAHNSRLVVQVGDLVRAGQEIAKAGSTGRSTGAARALRGLGQRPRGQPAQVPRRAAPRKSTPGRAASSGSTRRGVSLRARRCRLISPAAPHVTMPAAIDRAPCALFRFGGRLRRGRAPCRRPSRTGSSTCSTACSPASSAAATNACSASSTHRRQDQCARTGAGEALSDDAAARPRPPSSSERIADGETLDKLLPEAFAVCREAGRARARHAPLRRAADRRHGPAPGQDRRNAHRRRQDPGRDAAGVPQRAGRQGRARGHRQRLPGPPRRRLDGQALQLARPDRRRGLPGHAARATRSAAYAADITYGTNNEFGFDYLRDNMALSQGRPLPARPELRHRRRSRLDPDRRSAHPADHLRPGRRIARAVHPESTASSRS